MLPIIWFLVSPFRLPEPLSVTLFNPSLPQGILRLNSNEFDCVFTAAKGLTEQRLTELWDKIALKNQRPMYFLPYALLHLDWSISILSVPHYQEVSAFPL